MKVSFTKDTFGPALKRMVAELPDEMDRATARNAYLLQATIVKGIRTNDLATNEIANWPALSAAYAQRKREAGGSDKMLIGPDRHATATQPSHNGGELIRSIEVSRVTGGVYDVGTNLPYARALDKGYAPRKLPARPYMLPALLLAKPIMIENWDKVIRSVTRKR